MVIAITKVVCYAVRFSCAATPCIVFIVRLMQLVVNVALEVVVETEREQTLNNY
jgi:hypothetical protein